VPNHVTRAALLHCSQDQHDGVQTNVEALLHVCFHIAALPCAAHGLLLGRCDCRLLPAALRRSNVTRLTELYFLSGPT
jgi:hypothetical protein